ncbi:hypothetical protein [Aeromonas veronii]|uniref:hypothetical protein n=1 Tax=Aeromonas veronii TaxID=654 RepID=UPI0035B857F7
MNYQKFKTLTKIEQAVIIESQVKRKYFKSKKLYGLGICDVDFPVSMRFEGATVYHPAYTCWQNMLKRFYYNKNPNYISPALSALKYLCVIGGTRKDRYKEVLNDPNGLGPYLTTTTQITTAPIDFNY